ncbi:polymer-forming cytoskeletal protein [Enterococcus olivae]
MKKIKFASLAALVLVSGSLLAACSSDDDSATDASTVETSEVVETEASEEDVVSTASISDQADVIEAALSADGNWIIALTDDVTFDSDVTVAGEFHNRGDDAEDVYRKLALYDQDEDRNVTAEYTLTTPKLVVESPNFNIVHGTVVGDIEVKAEGFVLNGATVEGNITFDTQELQDSAVLDQEGASVTGDVTVAE